VLLGSVLPFVRCDSQRSGRRLFPRFGCESAAVSAATAAAAAAFWRTASLATARFGPLPLINSASDALRDPDRRNTSDAALLTHAR
jgi:hypothetical protein